MENERKTPPVIKVEFVGDEEKPKTGNEWHGNFYTVNKGSRYDQTSPMQSDHDNERQLKRKISRANTVGTVNMLFYCVLAFALPYFVLYIYEIAAMLSGTAMTNESYLAFVDYFFGSNTVISQITNMVIYAMMLLPGILIVWLFNRKKKYAELVPVKKVGFSKCIECFCVAMGVQTILSIPLSALLEWLSSIGIQLNEPQYAEPAGYASLTAVVLFLISMTVFPAFFEETAYRGFGTQGLLEKAPYAVWISSSVAFGLMHGKPVQMMSAIIFGLILGFYVIKFKSIWIGMFAHFMNNFIVTVVDLIADYNEGSAIVDTVYLIQFMLYAVLAICAVGFIVYRIIMKDLHFDLSPDAPKPGRQIKMLFTSVGFWVMMASAVLNFVVSNYRDEIMELFLHG